MAINILGILRGEWAGGGGREGVERGERVGRKDRCVETVPGIWYQVSG